MIIITEQTRLKIIIDNILLKLVLWFTSNFSFNLTTGSTERREDNF